MQLFNSPQTIEQLSEFDDFFKSPGIDCWKAQSGMINLHCFSAFYCTVTQLEETYKELRDHVAISFQGKTLQNAAERWNLYLVLLVKESIPEDVKQRITHDKFSTRKIVYSTGDELVDEEYIKSVINRSLLNIDVNPKPVRSESLNDELRNSHPKIANALERIPLMNNRENLSELLNLLSDE